MSATVLPKVWTVGQCVEQLDHSVSEKTLRREIAAGRLRARRIGRAVRVLDEDLAAWLRHDPTPEVTP